MHLHFSDTSDRRMTLSSACCSTNNHLQPPSLALRFPLNTSQVLRISAYHPQQQIHMSRCMLDQGVFWEGRTWGVKY